MIFSHKGYKQLYICALHSQKKNRIEKYRIEKSIEKAIYTL